MEIMAVHASSLCACTCTLAKYVAKSNLIVVVVIVVVIFVVSRQFKKSTAILKNLGQTHGGVYRVAPKLKIILDSDTSHAPSRHPPDTFQTPTRQTPSRLNDLSKFFCPHHRPEY